MFISLPYCLDQRPAPDDQGREGWEERDENGVGDEVKWKREKGTYPGADLESQYEYAKPYGYGEHGRT